MSKSEHDRKQQRFFKRFDRTFPIDFITKEHNAEKNQEGQEKKNGKGQRQNHHPFLPRRPIWPLSKRHHLFELHDSPWFPSSLRTPIMQYLEYSWIMEPPLMRRLFGQQTGAEMVAELILNEFVLCASTSSASSSRLDHDDDGGAVRGGCLEVLDLCSGGGGPMIGVAAALNKHLLFLTEKNLNSPTSFSSLNVVLSDLYPEAAAWERSNATMIRRFNSSGESGTTSSSSIRYYPKPVDATRVPAELMLAAPFSAPPEQQKKEQSTRATTTTRVRTLFNCLHHLDRPLAIGVLRDVIRTFANETDDNTSSPSSEDSNQQQQQKQSNEGGILIVEVVQRNLRPLLCVFFLTILICLLAPFFHSGIRWTPRNLLFIFIFPIVPFVVLFDGFMSCLRSYTVEELLEMALEAERLELEDRRRKNVGKSDRGGAGSHILEWAVAQRRFLPGLFPRAVLGETAGSFLCLIGKTRP